MRFGWVKHEYFAGYARLDLAGDLSPKLIATSDKYYHRSNSYFLLCFDFANLPQLFRFTQSVIVSPRSEVLVEVFHLLDKVQSMFLTILVRVCGFFISVSVSARLPEMGNIR